MMAEAEEHGGAEATRRVGAAKPGAEQVAAAVMHREARVTPTEVIVAVMMDLDETQAETRRDCHHINFLHPPAGLITYPGVTKGRIIQSGTKSKTATAGTMHRKAKATGALEPTALAVGSMQPEHTGTAAELSR
jgi:hypothetical protein